MKQHTSNISSEKILKIKALKKRLRRIYISQKGTIKSITKDILLALFSIVLIGFTLYFLTEQFEFKESTGVFVVSSSTSIFVSLTILILKFISFDKYANYSNVISEIIYELDCLGVDGEKINNQIKKKSLL